MKLSNFINLKLTTALIGIVAGSAQAISLSTYRVYLDNDNNTASFTMFNKGVVPETCNLSLVHNNFSEDGKMLPQDGNELPDNSAEPWMRYSPRNFTVAPRSPQTVRFTMRRKSNMTPAEYRSYLRVSCDKVEVPIKSTVSNSSNNVAKLTVQPRIVQNVPVIVRTGKLDASVKFDDFNVADGKVSFSISREGERSVYGKLEVINKSTNDMITFRNNVSIYPEVKKVSYSLSSSDLTADQLAIRFTEDTKYGGSITHQQDVR